MLWNAVIQALEKSGFKVWDTEESYLQAFLPLAGSRELELTLERVDDRTVSVGWTLGRDVVLERFGEATLVLEKDGTLKWTDAWAAEGERGEIVLYEAEHSMEPDPDWYDDEDPVPYFPLDAVLEALKRVADRNNQQRG